MISSVAQHKIKQFAFKRDFKPLLAMLDARSTLASNSPIHYHTMFRREAASPFVG